MDAGLITASPDSACVTIATQLFIFCTQVYSFLNRCFATVRYITRSELRQFICIWNLNILYYFLEENRPASPSQVSESDSKESEECKKGSHKLSQEATDGKEDEEGLTATTPLSEIPEDVVFLG